MTDTEKMEQAKRAFETLCRALDKDDWHYTKDEEKLAIVCGAQGEDLPIELVIRVDADRQLVMLLSQMSFEIKEDKRLEVAVAVGALNNMLVHGCFDCDVSTGKIFFRMTNSFMDSILGEEAIKYLIYCACQTVDEYNDKLLMLAKGMLSMEQFLKSLEEN